MKKVISVLLLFVVLFCFVSCGGTEEDSKTAEKTTEAVDENLLTVDITFPASFFSEESPATDVLTQEQIDSGYKSARINPDGSLTYTITKKGWRKLLKQAKEYTIETLMQLVDNPESPSIKKVEYNDDFTNITFYVERDAFESGFDKFATVMSFYSVGYYQYFNQQEPKTTLIYKDVITDEVFDVTNLPIEDSETSIESE